MRVLNHVAGAVDEDPITATTGVIVPNGGQLVVQSPGTSWTLVQQS